MTKPMTGALALLLTACTTTPKTTEAPPPLTAFECRKRVDGKRTTGWETVRLEPQTRDATLTLRFDADRAPGESSSPCDFTARWRFPQDLPPYTPMLHDRTRECRGSRLSPFAVSCDLLAPDFQLHSQSIRSTLVTHSAGPLSRREVVFEVWAPSQPVEPVPHESCQGLPVRDFAGHLTVPMLEAETFLESECRVLSGP